MECQKNIGMENIKILIDNKGKEIIKEINEFSKKELELFEFNLFVSTLGKKHLNKAVKNTESLKKLVKEDKVNLTEYEQLAEAF